MRSASGAPLLKNVLFFVCCFLSQAELESVQCFNEALTYDMCMAKDGGLVGSRPTISSALALAHRAPQALAIRIFAPRIETPGTRVRKCAFFFLFLYGHANNLPMAMSADSLSPKKQIPAISAGRVARGARRAETQRRGPA